MKDKKDKKEKREKRQKSWFGRALDDKRRDEPGAFWTYWVLRLFVIVALVRAIMRGDIESAAICVLVLLLYLVPMIIERRLDVDIPAALEIIIFVFVYAAEIMGELQSCFVRYPHWDTVLHTTWGFLCAALGFSLADLLNRSEKIKVELSPFYVALMGFCFSMTVGVFWEFIEFSMDRLFLLDMQKDTVVHIISSVALDPTDSNIPIVIKDIGDVSVDGRALGLGGYLDIGLYDTMEDLFVNFVGAIVFSFIGYFETKHNIGFVSKNLMPTRRSHDEPEGEGHPEVAD